MSTAMDGKVHKWVLSHKGLTSHQLIQLKRTTKQRKAAGSKSAHTAYMATLSSCLSMDFSPNDSSQYVLPSTCQYNVVLVVTCSKRVGRWVMFRPVM